MEQENEHHEFIIMFIMYYSPNNEYCCKKSALFSPEQPQYKRQVGLANPADSFHYSFCWICSSLLMLTIIKMINKTIMNLP